MGLVTVLSVFIILGCLVLLGYLFYRKSTSCVDNCETCSNGTCTKCTSGFGMDSNGTPDASGKCPPYTDPSAAALAVLKPLFYGPGGTPSAPVGNSLKNYMIILSWAISVDATQYSPSINYSNPTGNEFIVTIDGTDTMYHDKESAYMGIVNYVNTKNNLTGANALT